MRLSTKQTDIIREETARAFGQGATVHLFGSRVFDHRKGGDIDLYIETELPPAQAQQAASHLFARLQRRLGEQRIDIVTHCAGQPLRPIDQAALEHGIRL